MSDWRLVANFWLRPGNTRSSNNILGFIESTLGNLGTTRVGLFRADSGFYDKTIVALLKAKDISCIISARLTQATLHHRVLAVGAVWDDHATNPRPAFRLAVARKRRPWFEGLWANAGEPVNLVAAVKNG